MVWLGIYVGVTLVLAVLIVRKQRALDRWVVLATVWPFILIAVTGEHLKRSFFPKRPRRVA